MKKKPALIIGEFKKTEDGGFRGKITTLALKGVTVILQPCEERPKETSPAYTILTEDNRDIGSAWDGQDDMGRPEVSLKFEEPSFAPGNYILYKTGVEHGYTLTFRNYWKKPADKK